MKQLFGKYLYVMFTIALLAGAASLPGMAQDDASQPEAAEGQTSANRGLGGLFAESLQGLLQSGNLFVPNGQTAQPVEGSGDGQPERFALNFNNAPIDQVLKFISDLTKKVVLRSDEVQGQINIINPEDVTKERALEIIDTAFMLKGFTFIETESTIVVLPVSAAKQKGVDVQTGTVDAELGSRVITKVIHLNFAIASQLKESLGALVSENANMIADDRTRSLIITDTASNINRLEAIIRQLDKEGGVEGVVVRVFRLRYLSATEIGRSLDDLLENVVAASLSGGDANDRREQALVEVLSDRTTNSLIISAPGAAIEEVANFIQTLDIPMSDNLRQQTFPLRNGDAAQVTQSLSQIAQSLGSGNYRPIVVADVRTNSVIVSAFPEDVRIFEELIQTLDAGKSYEKLTEVFMMQNADAIVLSTMLEELIGSGGQSGNNRYYYYYPSSSDQSSVKIIEDQRLNALIITAKPSEMPMIKSLIEKLDQPLPESKEAPKVYPIKYARATDLEYILNSLFEDTQQSAGYFFFSIQQETLTGLSGKVKTIADPSTNSLIVIAGTPRAFGIVEELIDQLDRLAPEFSTTKVFNLKNSDAGYLALQLTELFEEDTAARGGNQGFFWYQNQSSQSNQQMNQLIGNVRIVSETRTNSLLVTTSSQFFPQIESLIEELDKDIAQVLVEVLIVEIIDINDNQVGIDWPDNIPISVEGTFEAPASGINLNRAAIISSAKFNTVLDMLSSSNNTRVVARPNIFSKDNLPSFVEVVSLIPTLGELSVNNITSQQGITYKEVGLKLTVTPHINDATMVTVDVNLETGQLLDTFFLETNNGRIPAFTRRTVDTVLTTSHGETAVLSGVIDSSFVDRESGIPLLRSIPVLGGVFRSKGKKRSSTELLTFITPYLVDDYRARQEILQRQSERIQRYGDLLQEVPDLKVRVGSMTDNGEIKIQEN